MSEKTRIGIITGPTASGKTGLAIALAGLMPAEVISADSIQIYRGMDIGSAKPTLAERQGIPHHMLDIVPPQTPFSAAEYQAQAMECIAEVASRGKLPLVVGGTGLYINSLVYPLDFTGSPADEELRRELAEQERLRPGALYGMLQGVDPDSAKRLHPNDTKRLIRAIEVFKLTGKPIGQDFTNADGLDIPYEPVMIGLTMPREQLYERINARVDDMMARGLFDETRGLIKTCPPDAPSMQGLGYKQLAAYLNGETTLEAAVEAIKRETRRFAKRQLTWFRRDERIRWLDISEYSGMADLARAALREFNMEVER